MVVRQLMKPWIGESLRSKGREKGEEPCLLQEGSKVESEAVGSGGDGARGEVARPAGLPQALGPETQMVVAQQTTGPVPDGGQEQLKEWLVRLALSCRPCVMHFVLELKVFLVYLKAVLLVYFLYKVFLLNIAKETIRESVNEMVVKPEEGILVVVFWDFWQSRCRHWWHFNCLRISFRWDLQRVHTSLCFNLREADRLLFKTKVGNGKPRDGDSGHTTRARDGKPRNGDPSRATTRNGESDDGGFSPRTKGSYGSAHGEPGSHANGEPGSHGTSQ